MPPETFIPADLRRKLVKALADTIDAHACLDVEDEISRLLGEVGGIWPGYCRPADTSPHGAVLDLKAHRAPQASSVISLANVKAA